MERNVSLSEEDVPHRKSSSGTVRSEGGVSQYMSKHGILPIYDSSESLDSRRSSTGIKIRRIPSLLDGTTRFPKLEECAHFHYDVVELGTIEAHLCDDDRENYHHNEEDRTEDTFLIRVKSNDKAWNIRRTFSNFRSLDKQLHRCIFDRKFSQLVELQRQDEEKENTDLRRLLRRYLERFSYLAGSMINCGSVLNWLELDNRGNRLLAVDDSGINTPAIAAAHAIKRYNSQAVDEISLEVGDIVSVIDMPPPEDTIWWRGKRGFEVGFFPGECVEVIGDKVPHSMATRILRGAAIRKPLIRRHGKLMSFLRTFFSTRPARNQLKQSGIVKERVFGCDLGEHLLNSGHDVPLVLKCCAEVIEEHGIVDGIYRLSGITSNIQKLRLAFDEDSVPDLCDDCYLQDIHSISSLLKMYLRELPNPLLTYQLYDKFAEAVRDEDNRLLRIHDVVQQLPPPHYRTTEYLMKHLAKVAAHGHDTGMHSKNLAIVWAPNLLRSKELEMGGGAAALQGVGIQAVVTECLICYSDIIFSDKMPSYSSPELQKAYKKPRPKSLAISTPTRLLTLEEARERAFVGGLIPVSQKFIDVGGGPENLPAKYHTVIDLPGHKKKSGTPAASKTKKSPVSGWKSIFSKPRSGSIKKARKSSIQDTLNLPPIQGKALTEEDVHNWKKRLRSAKSAESLLSLTSSNRSSNSRKGPENAMVLNVYKEERPHHKRSLSSDATAILHHHSHSAIFFDSGREMPIDVDTAVVPHVMEDEEMSPRKSHQLNREDPGKGSFIRGDSSRMALHHRRTPSAPNTPNQERNAATAKTRQVSHQKALSQPALEDSQVQRRQVYTYIHSSEESLDGEHVINGERLPKLKHDEQSAQKRSAKSTPQGRKKTKGNSPESIPKFPKEGVIQLHDSPGAQRKALLDLNSKSPDSPSKFFYSRNHDYAEIMSDEDNNKQSNHSLRESDILCSPCDMRDFIEHIDNKFAKHKQSETFIDDSPEKRLSNGSPGSVQNNEQFNRRVNDDYAQVNKPPKQNGARTSPTVAGLDYSKIEPHRGQDSKNSNGSTPSANSNSSNGVQGFHSRNKMSKCLSVPSDIAKSLENITVGSNVDLMSSVTISELSQSMDSFNHSFDENGRIVKDPRKRRSASCDSLTAADTTMCRTLREINKQIDSAFQQNVDRALQLEEEGYKRHGHSANDIPSLNVSDKFTAIVGQRASTHGSFEMVPAYAEVEEPHVELARENPTFLSSIPLDLFENKKTEISKKVKKSQSLDQPMEIASGVFGRHNSSSSDSSSEMARIDVTQHLQDKPSLHNQYVISGHAMFPTDDKTPQFPTDLSSSQSHQLQALPRTDNPGNFPDYARINKNKNQTTTKNVQGQHDASQNVFAEDFHQNPVVFNVSFDRQNNNSPVYYQLNSPQTVSSPGSDASPRPSPRSSPRNLQPVSPTGYKKPSLPPSPIAESWQTPRTFRRAEEQVGYTQQNVPSLSQSLNLTYDQMIQSQLHASASLPEVHVHQDTLTEQKSTIKKSTTESQLTNTIHVQPSYTPVPKPRKLSTDHQPESQQSPHDRMTIDDIKQAHKAVKEGEKMLQMLDSANAGQKLQDLVMEHMEGPRDDSYSRGRSPCVEAKQPHGTNFQTQGGIMQAPVANFQSQGGMAPPPAANFQTQGRATHETDFPSYSPTPAYNITVPSMTNVPAHVGSYQTSGADYHSTGNQNGGNYQAQGDITRIQVEAYKNFDDAYQTHVEAYPMASHDGSFQHKLDLYPTHVNASPNQLEFASQMRASPAQRSPRSVAPPGAVTEEKERMTIEDIRQAHKTVREGERALQMMDSSNAGRILTDVLYEQIPSDIDLVPMQKSKGSDKPIQVPDGSGQFNQLHVDVDFPGNAAPSFPSDLSFDPRQVPVLQTAQQYSKPQHRQEVDVTRHDKPQTQVTRHDQPQTQPINFQFAPKFQQVKPEPEQIIYKEPKTTQSKTVYPVKPVEMENDHMTIEDIKNAHKMLQEGEKVLHMMETSNAGRKMEDLMFEQMGRGSTSSNARNEPQSYRNEIPNSYSANEMYSQGQSEKPRFKEEFPQSYSNQDMSRYGDQIIASNLRSSMPASFPDNASFVQQTEPSMRRQASPKPPPAANDDEPMTFEDIKRAAQTVKEGEKALKKLDASNAGQKLEDVVMEHVKSGSQAKKKLRTTHDSDESSKTGVKMSSSYTESSNLTQSESQMSSSWSGPNTSEKPPNSISIPADKLPATLIESRCEKTAPSPIGEITESHMLQIQTFGDIDHDEFQNEVKRGKAIIAADKERINTALLPTPDTLPFSMSQDCKIVPQQPVVVCRASDVQNVNVPHGDILRAPSFIASAVQKPYTSVPSPKKRSPVKTVVSDMAPPEHVIMEVTRPSVIIGKPKSKKEPPMVSPKPTVQSSGSESSDNKYKERKNIPAQKHSQLSRQMAEVADEGSDSVTTEKSSTGPSDAEFTCVSSTDDDVFTDFSDGSNFLRRKKLIENRDFDFRASLGKMERVSSETVKIPIKVVDEMISSRSSLDESLLTLAAERHDIFSPEREEEPTFNTGSLRVKRSQKLKSLVELFESVSDTNDSDSSPVTRPKDQRHLTSSQPSIPTHASDAKYEADTDEEVTQPRVRPSSFRLRSRSRSRDRARKASGLGSDKENSLKSRSPTPNRKSTGSERSSREIERFPSSPSDSSSDYKSRKQKTKSEKYSSMGKPPRYRSNERTRTHSESSTSESEGSLHHDSALIRRLNESEVILRDQNRSELCPESVEFLETVENRARSTQKSTEEGFPEKCDLQRRGSIKELREFFECRKSDIEQEESSPSPISQPRLPRDRIKSSSPASFEHPQRSEKVSPSTLRYSLELPSSSSLSHSEGVLKTQPVRLGPKPFYGSKK